MASAATTRNVAVLLAGGIGERMRLDIPKQFLKIAGKPIIEHTLQALQENKRIDEIVVMITPGFKDQIHVITENFPKVRIVLEGGKTRNETSKLALQAINEDCNVIFHDAVRPFIDNEIINRCINALDSYNAVDVVIPSADTIIETDGVLITDIPDRSHLRRGQTPQAFKASTIRKAYEIAEKDLSFQATDDCSVVLKYLPDTPIAIVEGSESNIKVTNPLDATIADKLFQLRTLGTQDITDAEKKRLLRGKVLVVFGGSYGIGGELINLAQHYDLKTHSFSRSQNGIHVEQEEDVKRALRSVYEKEKRIDYIVNTAGQLTISALQDMKSEDITNSINVNYLAPVMIARHAKKYLAKTKGQLLLYTSSSYTRGRRDYSLYSSSKAAIVNLTQALAEEWYEDGVRINCINPERTATPMRHNAFGQEDPTKMLKASDVADASLNALIGNATGQVFDVRLR